MQFLTKYKPKIIDDFIIHQQLKKLLKLYISSGNIKLLFVGNSGTGKTTIINTIINSYYSDSQYNIKKNVMYIDNLKEQSIHDFRKNIRTFCTTFCTIPYKKKFIIIDDIDLIDESTQQIIRSNIDKFDNKINFIVSCSEIQNVIDNIQSRTNIIKLTLNTNIQLTEFFEFIREKESISIDSEATKYLIEISNNSIRILLGHIHKLLFYSNDFTIHNIRSICTNINHTIFDKYTKLWYIQKSRDDATKILYNIHNLGYSVMDILENYFNYIKITNIIDDHIKLLILPYICKYINIFHSEHEDEIELLLFTNDIINNILK